MAGSINYLTKVSKAGKKAPATALKTYIPAEVVRKLKLEHGDMILWSIRDRTVSVKAIKANQVANSQIDTNLRQKGD
jgi:bifunctional DNA-binding transcriptional regulator/antitoxin component of YhaV-PrlF toxin-antitoxin module